MSGVNLVNREIETRHLRSLIHHPHHTFPCKPTTPQTLLHMISKYTEINFLYERTTIIEMILDLGSFKTQSIHLQKIMILQLRT